jgi:putative NIF3 family GTP cyclohydrolase 1 type 2
MYKIKEIIAVLEEMAPLAYAEDFDNVRTLVGDQEAIATAVLVCHDALENVIEGKLLKLQLVVCFHPILFSGLKKITGKTTSSAPSLKL